MDSSGHHHRLQAPGLYRTRRVRRNGDERHLRRYSFVVACSDAQCCRLSGNGYPRLEHYAPRSVGASKRGTLCGWCDAAGPGHGAERDLRGLLGIGTFGRLSFGHRFSAGGHCCASNGGVAALGGGAACHRLVGDAWVQRPERPGVDGYTVRDRVANGRVCPVVGLGGYASATLACSLSFREARLSETGLPRITALGSWVDTVVAYVSESPRQGTKKEAGLDFWIMCRRGCQPGRMIMCHPYYPYLRSAKH